MASGFNKPSGDVSGVRPDSRGSVMEEALRNDGRRFDSSKIPTFKGPKPAKSVDEFYAADGLTPEEVNDIRYSGIRLDMSDVAILDDGLTTDPDHPAKIIDTHFRIANDAAAGALSLYKILLHQDIRLKLLAMAKEFEDVGAEAFVVMHMIRAFLGKRPDHAPVEVTVVRLRLSTGVENTTEREFCHVFPSPVPMPFGKGGDYRAAQAEWHEIDEDNKELFSHDFVQIFYDILSTMDPRAVRKSVSNFQPKLPLVICKTHAVQNVVMMFEYLHQRALLAQKANFPTNAPKTFVVPDKVSVGFCEIRAFDTAVRSVLRELLPTFETVKEKPAVRMANLCAYHKTTNKVECTTYCVSEIVEQLLLFARFWGCEYPNRFVEAYNVYTHIDQTAPTRLPAFDERDGTAPVKFGDNINILWHDHIKPLHPNLSIRTQSSKATVPTRDDVSDRGSDVDPKDYAQLIRSMTKRDDVSPYVNGVEKIPTGSANTDTKHFKPATPDSMTNSLTSMSLGVGRGIGRGLRRVPTPRPLAKVMEYQMLPTTPDAASSMTIPSSLARGSRSDMTPLPTPLQPTTSFASDTSVQSSGDSSVMMPPRSKLFSFLASREKPKLP